MAFVIDSDIATKITKMNQRVCWQESLLQQRRVDQTRFVLDDGQADDPEFSFLVIGDSGSGPHRGHNPQRRIAEQLLAQRKDCRFLLHTGDVVYLTGSSEFYPKNFIEPYREWLVGGDRGDCLCYNRMVFNQPFLPVPGNHDYYDLPLLYGALAQITVPLRRLLQSQLDLDIGWRGSGQGNVYALAFLDYLKALKLPGELAHHLEQHYTAKTSTGYCLRYQPGKFTRLPNRYYTFRVGGIDFFALDSNTFNAPPPLPDTRAGDDRRQRLVEERADLERQTDEILQQSARLNADNPQEMEQLDDLNAKLEQLEEVKRDIDKQLSGKDRAVIDQEQLEWLRERLIQSWFTDGVRGRVLFFHHPPYVSEATKWHQAQTLAVRQNLQMVLDAVANLVGERSQGRPVVDLVLNGHAHCLEYLQTLDTGHADSHTHWIICGGSGYSLRRQRQEGPVITENRSGTGNPIAKCQLFIGRSGQGNNKHRPYSCLRIDVKSGTPPKFVVRPFVSDRFHQQWHDYAAEPFEI
jgi:3',5'-cyclic AMP phosphodiesterase CpdA